MFLELWEYLDLKRTILHILGWMEAMLTRLGLQPLMGLLYRDRDVTGWKMWLIQTF